MTPQQLINQWLQEAAQLRADAEIRRKNGMHESSRGMRLKADHLTDCAEQLQRITPAP
jgi:hypothetical protein